MIMIILRTLYAYPAFSGHGPAVCRRVTSQGLLRLLQSPQIGVSNSWNNHVIVIRTCPSNKNNGLEILQDGRAFKYTLV
jgi:hypothetical protein